MDRTKTTWHYKQLFSKLIDKDWWLWTPSEDRIGNQQCIKSNPPISTNKNVFLLFMLLFLFPSHKTLPLFYKNNDLGFCLNFCPRIAFFLFQINICYFSFSLLFLGYHCINFRQSIYQIRKVIRDKKSII